MSGTLSFAPGQVSTTVDVAVNGDTTYENDETLSVALSAPVNVALGATPGTVTIVNDDALPQVSIDDRSVAEGDSGTTPATFTLSLTNPSAFPISVDVATSDQTASSPADFGAVSTTVVFAPGQVSKTVDVLVEGDAKDEFDETFSVDLTNPVGVAVADGTGVGTIVDDDAAPLVSIDDVAVTEGDAGTTTATFTVSLSAPSGKPIAVDSRQRPGHRGRAGRLHRRLRHRCRSRWGRRRRPSTSTSRAMSWTSSTNVRREPVEPRRRDAGHRGRHGDDPRRRPLPTVSVGDVSLAEGDAGTTIASFPVTVPGD